MGVQKGFYCCGINVGAEEMLYNDDQSHMRFSLEVLSCLITVIRLGREKMITFLERILEEKKRHYWFKEDNTLGHFWPLTFRSRVCYAVSNQKCFSLSLVSFNNGKRQNSHQAIKLNSLYLISPLNLSFSRNGLLQEFSFLSLKWLLNSSLYGCVIYFRNKNIKSYQFKI